MVHRRFRSQGLHLNLSCKTSFFEASTANIKIFRENLFASFAVQIEVGKLTVAQTTEKIVTKWIHCGRLGILGAVRLGAFVQDNARPNRCFILSTERPGLFFELFVLVDNIAQRRKYAL